MTEHTKNSNTETINFLDHLAAGRYQYLPSSLYRHINVRVIKHMGSYYMINYNKDTTIGYSELNEIIHFNRVDIFDISKVKIKYSKSDFRKIVAYIHCAITPRIMDSDIIVDSKTGDLYVTKLVDPEDKIYKLKLIYKIEEQDIKKILEYSSIEAIYTDFLIEQIKKSNSKIIHDNFNDCVKYMKTLLGQPPYRLIIPSNNDVDEKYVALSNTKDKSCILLFHEQNYKEQKDILSSDFNLIHDADWFKTVINTLAVAYTEHEYCSTNFIFDTDNLPIDIYYRIEPRGFCKRVSGNYFCHERLTISQIESITNTIIENKKRMEHTMNTLNPIPIKQNFMDYLAAGRYYFDTSDFIKKVNVEIVEKDGFYYMIDYNRDITVKCSKSNEVVWYTSAYALKSSSKLKYSKSEYRKIFAYVFCAISPHGVQITIDSKTGDFYIKKSNKISYESNKFEHNIYKIESKDIPKILTFPSVEEIYTEFLTEEVKQSNNKIIQNNIDECVHIIKDMILYLCEPIIVPSNIELDQEYVVLRHIKSNKLSIFLKQDYDDFKNSPAPYYEFVYGPDWFQKAINLIAVRETGYPPYFCNFEYKINKDNVEIKYKIITKGVIKPLDTYYFTKIISIDEIVLLQNRFEKQKKDIEDYMNKNSDNLDEMNLFKFIKQQIFNIPVQSEDNPNSMENHETTETEVHDLYTEIMKEIYKDDLISISIQDQKYKVTLKCIIHDKINYFGRDDTSFTILLSKEEIKNIFLYYNKPS